MIRDLVIHEVQKHGGSVELADRLIERTTQPFVTWLTRKLCKPVRDMTIVETLKTFAAMLNVPYSTIRFAYYEAAHRRLRELKKLEEYRALRDILETRYPYPTLWDEILQYALWECKRIAVEILVENGATVFYIEDTLNVQKSFAYDIRKKHLTKHIELKGDYKDDFEFNT